MKGAVVNWDSILLLLPVKNTSIFIGIVDKQQHWAEFMSNDTGSYSVTSASTGWDTLLVKNVQILLIL